MGSYSSYNKILDTVRTRKNVHADDVALQVFHDSTGAPNSNTEEVWTLMFIQEVQIRWHGRGALMGFMEELMRERSAPVDSDLDL